MTEFEKRLLVDFETKLLKFAEWGEEIEGRDDTGFLSGYMYCIIPEKYTMDIFYTGFIKFITEQFKENIVTEEYEFTEWLIDMVDKKLCINRMFVAEYDGRFEKDISDVAYENQTEDGLL